MKQNKRYLLLTLLVSLLLGGCSSNSALPEPVVIPESVSRREVQLMLQNTLTLPSGGTKAGEIAIADETRIDSLDIYVFGSDTEKGVYTFQERFSFRSDGSSVAGADMVALTQSGKSISAVFRPKKGMFCKVYCIVNRSVLIGADGAPFASFTKLIPPVRNSDGSTTSLKPGVPTEFGFKKLSLSRLLPLHSAGAVPLTAPLPMAGAWTIPIDMTDISASSKQNISITLVRLVARFDIKNDAAKSKFTLTHIGMGNGQSGICCFPFTGTDELITYPERDMTATTINTGVAVAGAYYTYPSAVTDHGFLILRGTYAKNEMEHIPVSYPISFKQTHDGIGGFIEVAENHRYAVEITDADPLRANATISLLDWSDGGKLDDYEPDNTLSAIVFDTPADANPATYDAATRTVMMSKTAGSTFSLTTASRAGVTATVSFAKNEDEPWFKKTVDDEVTTTATGKKQTKFTYVFNEAAVLSEYPNASIRLRDITGTCDSVVYVLPQ